MKTKKHLLGYTFIGYIVKTRKPHACLSPSTASTSSLAQVSFLLNIYVALEELCLIIIITPN